MRIPTIILLVLALAGCTDTHNIRRSGSQDTTLDAAASAYVAVPENGRYGETVYPDSGRMTTSEIIWAFTPHLEKATRGKRIESRGEALATARSGGYTYLIFPEILHWEDRATEWSGLPDRIVVEVSVIDVATAGIIDSARIEGKSKWATLGGDRPQDLLKKPLEDYARSLFP